MAHKLEWFRAGQHFIQIKSLSSLANKLAINCERINLHLLIKDDIQVLSKPDASEIYGFVVVHNEQYVEAVKLIGQILAKHFNAKSDKEPPKDDVPPSRPYLVRLARADNSSVTFNFDDVYLLVEGLLEYSIEMIINVEEMASDNTNALRDYRIKTYKVKLTEEQCRAFEKHAKRVWLKISIEPI